MIRVDPEWIGGTTADIYTIKHCMLLPPIDDFVGRAVSVHTKVVTLSTVTDLFRPDRSPS